MVRIIEPSLGECEKKLVLDIIQSQQLTRGKWTALFEKEFGAYLGVKYVYSVCSGTVALFIALKALNAEGKRVIVPAMSFMATIDAVLLANAEPIVVDIDEYFTMDLNSLEYAVKRYKPHVVIPVHLYGQCADMEGIMTLSERYGFYILEDAAQAHGAMYMGKIAGSIGHLSAFSFYASKNLPMGEGGAIATDDPSIAKSIKKWIDFGDHPAFNVRITEFQAAIGLCQLRTLKERNLRRRLNAQYYREALGKDFIHPKERALSTHSYHLYTLRHPERDKIVDSLKNAGVDARIYYPYLLNELRNSKHTPLPNAQRYRSEVFSIPVHSQLSDSQREFVASSLLQAVEDLILFNARS
ncbi:MAG: DegT/DnrJ/EryC1/StrS family aminotransferase [Aquificaceae bacterium]|nr:DegT/DnrJ/EryC1/StrS family aminotransferase [Aquificaceae bacterium]MDW8236872.1 DegT/DnrJ/EryC1/StrS family aminotransferase [Aquificaceae bacterium]